MVGTPIRKTNWILGLSAFYHDSTACLLKDGRIIAAAQEERFTRKKYDAGFPHQAIRYCLREGGISLMDLRYIVFYDKPLLKFERLVETYLSFAPKGIRSFMAAMPIWLKEKLMLKKLLQRELRAVFGGAAALPPILFTEHHESHAASAFYPSPYDTAAVLCIDGVGEWATTSAWLGEGNRLTPLWEILFPHSLGLLYATFTYYTGFKINSDEYKVMGLAPYGEPRYVKTIYDHLIDLKPDGTFRLDMSYFDYCTGLTMTNEKFHTLFGGPPRQPETSLTQREMDLARSIQEVTEEIMLRLAKTLHRETGAENLCLAGGVALNCVGNGRILREGPFRSLWIQPAAGDAGGALGAALAAWYQFDGQPREADGVNDGMQGSFLGPSFSNEEIEQFLKKQGASYVYLKDDMLFDQIARELASGKVVGWFQGRMEYGPRALGGRSILGDARNPQMQSIINLKIKYRESFRPFAPSVLQERLSDYFDMRTDSPYMLLVAPVLEKHRTTISKEQRTLWGIDLLRVPRSDIPAVTHVDYSARIQTVSAETNPRYYKLLKAFEAQTGCGVIVNTSFNVREEPIVCSPEDAYRCFMRTDMDVLVLENYVLDKINQKPLVENMDWGEESQAGFTNFSPELPKDKFVLEGEQDDIPKETIRDGGILFFKQNSEILCCPKCAGNLVVGSDGIECSDCYQDYQISGNIPLLFWPNEWESSKGDVTDIVKEFYEKTPFPNYDDFDNVGSLIQKAKQGVFARLLDDQIPFGARILECGCGTGQLSNFLSIANRTVVGTDICLNSLKLAQEFKDKNKLKRVYFLQMNLFRPVFRPETFDLIICNGVLHHTSDPFLGYKSISRLVKPNGYIIIGLYHKYGRILTDIRRVIFKITKNRFKFLDSRLIEKDVREIRKNTWFADQYQHPHESKHTIREVQNWFEKNGFEFIKSIPKAGIFATFDENEKLFKREPLASWFEFMMMLTASKDGGFFIVIGQKKS